MINHINYDSFLASQWTILPGQDQLTCVTSVIFGPPGKIGERFSRFFLGEEADVHRLGSVT